MLFLLRKIRRKLLTDNKVTTYLLYAIGEIVLVVVGILIAVSIDDWSEQKKLLNQEDAYLKRLIAENKQDVQSFDLIINETKNALQSIDVFCKALNDQNTSDSALLAATHQYMIYGSVVPTFGASRSTFDDLSNTGNLKVITNYDLRNKIVQHYAEIQKVQERLNIDIDWAVGLDMPFYFEMDAMKFVPNTAHLFPKSTEKELANELRKNKLKYINSAAGGYWVDQDVIDLLTQLKTQTEVLIKQMESELGIESQQTLPDPLAAGWEGESVCEVLQENADVRVLECTFPPGVGHERHYHNPHVGFTIAGGKMRITDTTGTRVVDVIAGSSFESKGVEWHEVLNVGTTTAKFLIIEYK
jgi:quercetin dioxygenase-like cupin family protein